MVRSKLIFLSSVSEKSNKKTISVKEPVKLFLSNSAYKIIASMPERSTAVPRQDGKNNSFK